MVSGYFGRQGIGTDASADLTQEVFLAVLANIATLRNPASFRSWLFGIARNKLLQHLESRRLDVRPREGAPERLPELMPDHGPGALEQSLEKERRTKLREALEELPQQMRACVKLSVVEELEQTVSANLNRAVRLRQSILQRAFTGGLV